MNTLQRTSSPGLFLCLIITVTATVFSLFPVGSGAVDDAVEAVDHATGFAEDVTDETHYFYNNTRQAAAAATNGAISAISAAVHVFNETKGVVIGAIHGGAQGSAQFPGFLLGFLCVAVAWFLPGYLLL